MRILLSIALLFSSAALLTACPIVITCKDVGCPSGSICNEATGDCEEQVRKCSPGGCRSGEVCDEGTGQCRPERLRCTEQFTCPTGQSCNAASGFCEPAFQCESDDDCSLAEQCDTSTQECEARTCNDDDGCPASYVCDDDAECAPGCRPGEDGCSGRQFCLVLNGESVGRCVPNCRVDIECPFGHVCDLTDSPESRCVAEGPCTADVDCRSDEVCLDESCVQPPCSSDEDCLESQLCESSTRTCREAMCVEDNFGATRPNHSLETAATLDFGTYTQLTLCAGRSDWFGVHVRGTDIVRIRLQHDPDRDLDLYVYDENGEALVANEQLGSVSSLKFAAGRTRTIYVEVRSRTFEGATYDLKLSKEVCENDNFEENDSIDEATVVGSSVGVPTDLALRSCGFDEDWFRIDQRDAANGLRIERGSGPPDLEVTLFSPDGETLAVKRDAPFEALRSGASGDWFVRARGSLGQTGDYRLRFEVLPPWTCDGAGENETPATAVPALRDGPTIFTFCPIGSAWEVVWIRLEVDDSGILQARARALGDVPNLEMVLIAEREGETEFVRNAVEVDGVPVIAAAVDPEPTWYLRISSPANVGRIVSEPRLEIDYSVR